MVGLHDRLAAIARWFGTPLISFGGARVSAGGLLQVALALVIVFVVGRALRRALAQRLLPHLHLESGLAYAISNIGFYLFVTIGWLVVIQASGVNLTSLTVLVGALGVGVGFGLQEVASNFISGLILLLERPIEVGDHIQVGELDGQVTRINIRATEVLTNDSIAVIVPNKDFVTLQVVNWSRGGDSIRVHVPIGVAYGTDPKRVEAALFEAVATIPEVLRDPPPEVRLVGFGDSSIDFEVLTWTRELLQRRPALVSKVNYAIYDVFARHNIEIPFPQRDVHLRTAVPLAVIAPPGQGQPGPA
jgi:small-conductance mechanosensitive channel